MHWVNCEACGGSGEIVRANPNARDPSDEYAELCAACEGTGRDCADMDIVDQLKSLKCDPGPTHSPNECEMQPCACLVQAEAAAEIEKLRAALQAAEAADQKAINCEDHAPEMAPESCAECFPLADDARLKRWAALGINQVSS